MQEMPDEIFEWTELIFPGGKRVLKENAPDEIRRKAIEFEKDFFKKTARRRITNLDIDEIAK